MNPVLERVDGHDAENALCRRVAQEDVDERDHLQGLAEAHAVGKDTAEAARPAKTTHALHDIVEEKANSANLTKEGGTNTERRKKGGGGGEPVSKHKHNF